MQNSARCVLPVTSISRWRKRRSTSQGGQSPLFGDLPERDFQLVEAVVARLVHARRLAGRAEEHAGEQVRQRRMVVPVAEQAAQQVGPAQDGAVRRRRAAEDDVVAAAGAGVAAVEHEFFRAEPRLPGLLVEVVVFSTSSSQLWAGWMLTSRTPGSGVSLKWLSRWIVRRRVALDEHRQAQLGGRVLDGGDEVEIILQHAAAAAGRRAAGRRAARRTEWCGRRRRRIGRSPPAARCEAVRPPMRSPVRRTSEERPTPLPCRGGSGPRGAVGSSSTNGSRCSGAVPRQRVQRQAEAHRRIAGDQVHVLAAQEPPAAHPARPRRRSPGRSGRA